MADRYWVGGNGTWSSTNTTRWSATSGGAAGASVPTSLDKVYIDVNSGGSGSTITIAAGFDAVCYSFSRTRNFTLTSSNGSQSLIVGDVSGGLNSGDYIDTAGVIGGMYSVVILGSTSGTPSVLNGGNISQTVPVFMNQGSIKASGNVTIGSQVYVQNGTTLDVSGYSFQTRGLSMYSGTTLIASGTTMTMPDGGSWYLDSGVSFNPSSMISLSMTNCVGFSDHSSTPRTYPSISFNTGSGNTLSYNTPNAAMTITALTIQRNGMTVGGGQTLIIGTIDTSGVTVGSGRLTTPSGTTPFTLSSASGTRQLNNLVISNCTATGGATFTANTSSVDAGNNTGIQFANSRGLFAFFG